MLVGLFPVTEWSELFFHCSDDLCVLWLFAELSTYYAYKSNVGSPFTHNINKITKEKILVYKVRSHELNIVDLFVA